MTATIAEMIPAMALQPRTMPHDVMAEQGVLGSMLVGGPQVIEEMHSDLGVEAFYVPAHQTIFAAIVSRHAGGDPVELITLTDELRSMAMLDQVGGVPAVTELFTMVASAAMATYYADIVRDKWLLRRLIEGATETAKQAYDPIGETQEKIDGAQKFFTDLALSLSKRGATMRPSSETAPAAMAELEAIYHNRGGTYGLSTGLHGFDRMTNGLKGGDLFCIAARPSMGKTALGLRIAEYAAIEGKCGVLFFSLEMSWMQLMQRMILSRGRVALQHSRDGMMKQDDIPRLRRVSGEISTSTLLIDDSGGLRLFELTARARKGCAQGVKLIVLDYLQLMDGGGRRSESRAQELSEIANGLKKVARELDIPIIMLAQVNRKAEDRPGSKPRLSDLKESGAIEEASDIVAFIHRAEYYEQDPSKKADLEGEATLIVAKHRNGPTGELPVSFVKEFTRFENRTGESLYSNNAEHRQENKRQ